MARINPTKAAADEFANMPQDYQNAWKDLYSEVSQRV
jgi:hypothetical protein